VYFPFRVIVVTHAAYTGAIIFEIMFKINRYSTLTLEPKGTTEATEPNLLADMAIVAISNQIIYRTRCIKSDRVAKMDRTPCNIFSPYISRDACVHLQD
jgi:hypothetical protein